jgi:hypothetical protein
MIRSPPAYREAKHHASRTIPHHEEVWKIMMLDASWFDVVEDSKTMASAMQKFGGEIALLRALFDAALQNVFHLDTRSKWSHMRHYSGKQHIGGRTRGVANNFWMVVPALDGKGKEVVLGRCVTRKGAERTFIIHALRIAWNRHRGEWLRDEFAHLKPKWEMWLDSYAGTRARTSGSAAPNPVMSEELARNTYRC